MAIYRLESFRTEKNELFSGMSLLRITAYTLVVRTVPMGQQQTLILKLNHSLNLYNRHNHT